MLALFVLARACGALDAGPLQIVPLLESATSIARGRTIAETLLAQSGVPRPRRGLRRRVGNHARLFRQRPRSPGSSRASWSIYRAQARARRASRRATASTLRFFHGRGGSVGRGAADAREAVAAQPPQMRSGRFKVTEQGEVISGALRPAVARAAQSRAGGHLGARPASARAAGSIRPDGSRCSTGSPQRRRAAYVDLIEAPGFVDVLRRRARRSTRSARCRSARARAGAASSARSPTCARSRGRSAGGRRARCCRAGTDSAAAVAAEPGELANRCARWRATSRSSARCCATSNARWRSPISRSSSATRANWSPTQRARERFVTRIAPSTTPRSTAMLLEILEHERLLQDDPTLARSIALRNPYVDPLSLLQVRLLQGVSRPAGKTRRPTCATPSGFRSTASRPVCASRVKGP